MKQIFALIVAFIITTTAFSQTNPTSETLPYTQDFSTLSSGSSSYPNGWQGWQLSSSGASGTFRTNAATGDLSLNASSSASTTAGGVHNYNGKMGILQSSSNDPAIVLAITTSTLSTISVTYDIMTLRNPYDGTSNTRINEITLQYRIGSSGSFTSISGIEYQNNTTTQTGSGVTTPQNLSTKTIVLPTSCDNQALVQIRWVGRDVSGSGSRPSFALDNISISSGGSSSSSTAWQLIGNAGTTSGTNFIGTTDNVGFNVKVNNSNKLIFNTNHLISFNDASGNPFTYFDGTNNRMGINKSTPAKTLEVNGTLRVGDGNANYLDIWYDGAHNIIDAQGEDLLINYYANKNCAIGPGSLTASGVFTAQKDAYFATSYGSVGIGTNTPTQKFEVVHNDGVGISAGMALTNLSTANKNSEIKFNQGATTLWSIGNDVTHNNLQDFFIFDNVAYQTRFLIDANGKTGIGTGTPTQRLEVAHTDSEGGININQVDQINNYKKSEIKFSLQGQEEWAIGSHLNGNDNSFFIWSHLASRTALYIAENGKVAIGGLTIPTGNSIYMLYVDGGIATRDIKVTANVFPDYVFATDYKLTPIEELERYIKKHHHLPNIQSAKEVEKNDGFEIGDMQIKLLKTVEEQTLYIIDLQKQLNELKKKVNELNAK